MKTEEEIRDETIKENAQATTEFIDALAQVINDFRNRPIQLATAIGALEMIKLDLINEYGD